MKSRSYTNPWTYRGAVWDEAELDRCAAFVYLLTHRATGRRYIGRKTLWGMRKPNRKATRRKRTESDWRRYYGSSDDVKAIVRTEGGDAFDREILWLCRTRKQASYLEEKELFSRAVLETDAYFNTNIAGRYFSKEAREPR